MAGFFDSLFSSSNAQPAPTATTAEQATTAAPINTGTTAPTVGAATAQQPAVVAAPEAPLDQFKTLWDTDPASQQSGQQLNFNIDPAQLAAIADKLDFAQMVPQAIQDRIAAGGADAVAASMEANNLIARAVYQQNALATTKLVEATYLQAQNKLEAAIDKRFKTLGLADTTAAKNPALTNPAVKPLVDMIQQQIITKYPNATSAEISAKVNEYFATVGAAFNPELASKANQNAATANGFMQVTQPETDWAAYLFSPNSK